MNNFEEEYPSYDQQIAINNFLAMTESSDIVEARKILQDNNWDVTQAVNQYLAHKSTGFHQPVASEPLNYGASQMYSGQSLFSNRAMQQDHTRGFQPGDYVQEDQGSVLDLFSPITNTVSKSASAIGGFIKKGWNYIVPVAVRGCSPGGEEFLHVFDTKYKKIGRPRFEMGTYKEICDMSKQKLRPIFLYIHNNSANGTDNFVKKVLADQLIISLLDENYLSYGLDYNTREGTNVAKEIELKETPYIAIIRINKEQKSVVIASMEGENINVEDLSTLLTENVETYNVLQEEEKKESIPRQNIVNPQQNEWDDDIAALISSMNEQHQQQQVPIQSKLEHDRMLQQIQKQEFEEALRIDREKAAKQRVEEENVKEQERRNTESLKNKEKLKEEIKARLTEEPPQSDKSAATIVFRLPQSGERITRRFNKTEKVQMLYDYIDSMDIKFEGDGNYEIMQNMPVKYYNDKEKTLEEEGLHPRALLQIKEI